MTDAYLKNHPQIALNRADWALSPGKVWLVHPVDGLYDALRAPVPDVEGPPLPLIRGEVGRIDADIRFIVTPADEPPLFEDDPLPGTAEALAELKEWARDIELRHYGDIDPRTYGLAAGIDPPEVAKLRNEAMRAMLDNVAPTSAWTRGIAAVAVAEKKKAAESPKDIVEERNDVRGGWLWQVRTRRDGIVRERRLGRHDPSAADGFVACD